MGVQGSGYYLAKTHLMEMRPSWQVADLATVIMDNSLRGTEDFPEDPGEPWKPSLG